MLHHVFNHGTYHRGQLINMLRQLGVEKLPQTDFSVWTRSQKIISIFFFHLCRPWRRSRTTPAESCGGPERGQGLGPHVGEGVVAGVGLQDAEAQQDADRADVSHQEVEVAGARGFRGCGGWR